LVIYPTCGLRVKNQIENHLLGRTICMESNMGSSVAEDMDLKRFLAAMSQVTEGIAAGKEQIILDIRDIVTPCLPAALMIQEAAALHGYNVRVLTMNPVNVN
jgi:hypothetical protein